MNQTTRIVAAPVGSLKARFTTAEFLRIVEAASLQDIRLELIDGELHRMSPPMSNHVFRQTSVISVLLQAAGTSVRAAVEVGIDLGDDSIVTCDAALLKIVETGNRFFRPEEVVLVVEVAETTADRDLGMKRLKYAVAGIPEYWVVDGKRAVTHVYRKPSDGDYAEISVVPFGEPLAVPETQATVKLG